MDDHHLDYVRIVEVLIAVAGGCSVVAGGAWACYRFASVARRNWYALTHLHDHFGDDAVSNLAAIIRDVEAGQGELEIRQRISERHLQIGIYVCDPSGSCTWCNDVLAEAFGLDSREILGHGWLAAISKPDQQRVYNVWKAAIDEHLPYFESYRVEPSDSTPWVADTEAWPVTARNGELLCYVGYVINQRKIDGTTTRKP